MKEGSPESIPNYSILSIKYEPSFKELIRWDVKSLTGRLLFQRVPPKIGLPERLLNLGCGKTRFSNFVNADFFSFGLRPKARRGKPDWMLDLRYTLPCADNYWDGIFMEHTLEHLCPRDALRLLTEINRVLKKDCWVRLSVPDLRKYVEYYLFPSKSHGEFKKWGTGAEALRALTQNWTHRSTWDCHLLTNMLRDVGFINVKEVSFGEGTDERIIKDNDNRKWESLYMEAQKSNGKLKES